MKINEIVRVTGICHYYGLEAVVTGIEGDTLQLQVLTDQPETGDLIPGSLVIAVKADSVAPASTETMARAIIAREA